MQYRSILGCALYADILKPATVLSLCLHDDELDVVTGIKSILKSSGSLKNMAKTEPKEWPTVKLVQDRIRSEGQTNYIRVLVLLTLMTQVRNSQ